MNDFEYIYERLNKSKFRSSFKLKEKELEYIKRIGLDKVNDHAFDFIIKRLKPAIIENDGKQTPMKGHPIFIAQHATATCCRECLYKWHKIEKNKELNDKEINYIVNLLMYWIKRNIGEKNEKM